MTPEEAKEFVDQQLDNCTNSAGVSGKVYILHRKDVYVICERLLHEVERRNLATDFRLAIDCLAEPIENPIEPTTYGFLAGGKNQTSIH